MTEQEKRAKVKAVQVDLEEAYEILKNHRHPSDEKDKLALNVVSGSKQRSLRVTNHNKVPVLITSPMKIDVVKDKAKSTRKDDKQQTGKEVDRN